MLDKAVQRYVARQYYSAIRSVDREATYRLPGRRRMGYTDTERNVPLAEALGAICVQRFDDSRNSAIHTTFRSSLRSSSIREPRYPLLRVVFIGCQAWYATALLLVGFRCDGARPRRQACTAESREEFGDTRATLPPSRCRFRETDTESVIAGQPPRIQEGYPVDTTDSMIPPQVHLRRPDRKSVV